MGPCAACHIAGDADGEGAVFYFCYQADGFALAVDADIGNVLPGKEVSGCILGEDIQFICCLEPRISFDRYGIGSVLEVSQCLV